MLPALLELEFGPMAGAEPEMALYPYGLDHIYPGGLCLCPCLTLYT